MRRRPIAIVNDRWPLARRHRWFLERVLRWRNPRAAPMPAATPVARILQRARPVRWQRLALAIHHAPRFIGRLAREHTATTVRSLRSTVYAREMVERLVERERAPAMRLIEVRMGREAAAGLLAAGESRVAHAPAAVMGAAPLPMTVSRQVAAASNAAPQPSVPGPQPFLAWPNAQSPLAPMPARQAPLQLPPQELSRVTDHVLEQLDRRVLSYRERVGQV